MKKGLSYAKKVASHMTFDVEHLVTVKQVWFISYCFFPTILGVIQGKKFSMFGTVLCTYNLDC